MNSPYATFALDCDKYEIKDAHQEFTDQDVLWFIREIAESDDAGEELESWGICDKHSNAVPMIVEMCVQWRKDQSKVAAVAGANFWRMMKAGALNKFEYDMKNG